MTVHQKLEDSLRRFALVCAGDRVLVAVSGGPDSVALLHILHELREQFGVHLEVAHLQHGIRGEEADDDARFVRELSERLALPVHIREMSIPELRATAGRGNLEELARRERYRFFFDLANKRNLNKIATAHTEDDQAETVLMWLLRGAGRKGLGGMAPSRTVHISAAESSKQLTIIRPFLGIAKKEIIRFLKDKNLQFRFDRSNEDMTFLRNWLRHDLLPRLTRRSDARLSSRLAQTAEVLRDETDYLELLAQQELDSLCAHGSVSRAGFLRQPKAMQRRLLRLWIKRVRGHLRGLDFAHGEALLGMISDGPPQSRLGIPGGWELVREYDKLGLARTAAGSRKVCYTYPLVISEPVAVPEAGITIESRLASGSEIDLPKSHFEAVFDLATLTGPLVVRNFRHGDRFQPLGMEGRKKVKDLFIEKKVPLSTRATLPLLVMGEEVLWLPGYGRSDIGRIDLHSKEILRLSAVRNRQLQGSPTGELLVHMEARNDIAPAPSGQKN